MTTGRSFTHKTITEQRKILDHILEKHTSPVIKPNPLHKTGMSLILDQQQVIDKLLAGFKAPGKDWLRAEGCIGLS
jgi:hypothetical protein